MSTPEQTAFKKLVEKYLDGTASAQEIETIEAYYQLFAGTPNALDQLDEESQNKLALHLKAGVTRKIKSFDKPAVPLYSRWKIAVAAAAAVAAIVVGVWYFNAGEIASVPRNDVAQNDIAPGKNGATIALANGKVIQLSDAKTGVIVGNGKIVYSSLRAGEAAKQSPLHDEIASIPRNDGNAQTLTASTAKGQTYQFTLPDGTKVWLNADSKIEFPSNFVNSKTRNVKLSGEGYFEVAKDKAHPFMVATEDQQVEVLGTHFNINAYKDESSVRTTLLEGSVRVASLPESLPRLHVGGERSVVLKPNQQSILTDSRIAVANVDVNEIVSWKDGYFRFYEVDLETFMTTIARWYDIEVQYQGGINKYKDLAFGGSVSRSKNISSVLKILAQTGKVKYKIEGKKVTITR